MSTCHLGQSNKAPTLLSMSSGCGGTLLLDRGSFTSPGYPGNHPVAKQCRWLIRSPARRRIAIDFTDFLIADVDSCEHNFVSVYDGDSSSAPLVGTYCGNVSLCFSLEENIKNCICWKLSKRSTVCVENWWKNRKITTNIVCTCWCLALLLLQFVKNKKKLKNLVND